MAAPLHPLPRLHQLMRDHRVTVKSLAGVIGRSEGYMRRRVGADTYLLDLPLEEIDTLARFFGVPASELGRVTDHRHEGEARCRLCIANDVDGLVDEVAEAMWEGRREAGPMDVGPWATAGEYWHETFRDHARAAVQLLQGSVGRR